MVRGWPSDARGWRLWKIISRAMVPSLFRRLCGLIWGPIEFRPSPDLTRHFVPIKKGPRHKNARPLSPGDSSSRKLHFSHGDFVYMDGVTARHFSGDIHFHAQVLVG